MKNGEAEGYKIWVDRGGTFTDLIGVAPNGQVTTCKLLSKNEHQYEDATIEGIRRLLGLREDQAIPVDHIESIRIGTTLATNALLERKGAPMAFVTSIGFKDALRISFQQRPDLFALHIKKPDMLYQSVIETTQRFDVSGDEISPLNETSLHNQLVQAKKQGIKSVAIAFMHAYKFHDDEMRAKQIASEIGFDEVICSHEIGRVMGYVMRSNTTVVDAYLTPVFGVYLSHLQHQLPGVNLLMMQSNGGLLPVEKYRAKDSLLSGPAGGVIAGVRLTEQASFKKCITFDMGGTSTDVAYYDGELIRNFESTIAGIPVQLPMLAIETIAAGGGSIIHFDQGRFCVGPESAGADPGPACYGKGGPLTITDCHVLLNHIRPDIFPQCFGYDSDQPINQQIVVEKFNQLTESINKMQAQQYSNQQVAEGFIRVTIIQMASAIKKITLQKGYDLDRSVMCCFGGAGPQHACAVADELGINDVLISPYASLLSAMGMGLADIRSIKQLSVELPIELTLPTLSMLYDQLIASFESADCDELCIIHHKQLHLKYEGTDTVLVLPLQDNIESIFHQLYLSTYGFQMSDRRIICQSISVERIIASDQTINKSNADISRSHINMPGIIERDQLTKQHATSGPALIAEQHTVTVLEKGWAATIDDAQNIRLTREHKREIETIAIDRPDPIWLEVFNHLYMSIAEEMGEALANTAYSVNIKERRDFSCAIFDANGDLVANAPHMPVHLGSMGVSVKAIKTHFAATMREGDVYMLNDPYAGGTHLPDVTVVTPIFLADDQPLFYVASRGHHADIGGSQPGSMPADSTTIEQEGILFTYAHIVKSGVFDTEYVTQQLNKMPYPARNVDQNIADLKAQIAANQRGANQLKVMVEKYNVSVVGAYMGFVQQNAEQAVREVIACLSDGSFVQRMDCGAEIHVAIRVNNAQKSCEIDFTGTHGAEHSNFNAPKAVTIAAVLYVFRCLVKCNIPLNQGCLKPITLIIPEGSLLDPIKPRAVVAGNVETSQNIVEALFSAMNIMAQSQSTMNNVTFGSKHYQYYETIAGGSGAGNGFHGADAVQVHMTNTRLTDPEILEFRFPVLLKRFEIRNNSAGQGMYTGGQGVIREIQFYEPMTVNILSEHRRYNPLGMNGGSDAQCGENSIIREDGKKEQLGACATCNVNSGDTLQVKTPGGGGYG